MPKQNGRGHKGFDFRGALAASGITRRVRWHDLRHTCASSLVAGWWGGRPWRLEEVREMLGHTSIKVTERYSPLRR
jgi:integrase